VIPLTDHADYGEAKLLRTAKVFDTSEMPHADGPDQIPIASLERYLKGKLVEH
jgi:hypothetical protein